MTAHIRAAKPGGPRYVQNMFNDDRRDFPNLVLLCLGHHNTIDGPDRDKYTIELLEKWKAEREKTSWEDLKGLREVTEDRLQEMISEALESQTTRLEEAIGRFAVFDPGAARILRELATGLNPDTVDMLIFTASQLKPALNPDVIDMLTYAANQLTPVLNSERVDDLNAAAGTLQNSTRELNESADTLYGLLGDLSRRIDELRRLQDGM